MKIVLVDARGDRKRNEKAAIRKAIIEWLTGNGGIANITKCSKDTGFHRTTVSRHFKEIAKEQEIDG